MKGFIRKAIVAGGSVSLLGLSIGCSHTYQDFVDPCYPQRYESMAREEALAAAAPQQQNGHVLDQTVWNYHFEAGSDMLTTGGMEHLAYLARRRPQPDTMVYLQTAQDVPYDAKTPEKFIAAKEDLDARRSQAVKKHLNALTAGRKQDFQVVVHDPAEVGISATYAGNLVNRLNLGVQSGLPTGGSSVSGGAGASGSSGTVGTSGSTGSGSGGSGGSR